MSDFQEFAKIARYSRPIVITEKIDGTCGLVHVDGEGNVRAGSKSRWITPEEDNFGFARWVKEHEAELKTLGAGYHYGEWWGSGIQRGYGLKEKRWSLFNVSKWRDTRPSCCNVVPILYEGQMEQTAIEMALSELNTFGSKAAPSFKPAEGVVVYHMQGNLYFKKTILHDEIPKSVLERQP